MSTEKEKQFLRALAEVLDVYDVALCAEKDNVFFTFEDGDPKTYSKLYTSRCHSTAYEIRLIERTL